MGKKMSNAPVYYALAQAQFNTVAAMAKYVDEVQDNFRIKGYTLFEQEMIAHLEISSSGSAASEPRVVHSNRWLFTKSDRKSGFILDTNSLTYHTTHYETSEVFLPELLTGLAVVHDVVKLDHLARLGLRYLDAVLPQKNESVDSYLMQGLHGILRENPRFSQYEASFGTNTEPIITEGILVVKLFKRTSQLGYPPDLEPSGLVPMERFNSTDEKPHAVIDTDHFVLGKMPLDFPQLKRQLESLHETLKEAFVEMTTDHARAFWSMPFQEGLR